MMETKLSLVLQSMIHSQSLMRRSHEVSATTRVGLAIADCQLPIFDWRWRYSQLAIGNQKSKIRRPTRYRVVVLTSWDRGVSECLEVDDMFVAARKRSNKNVALV